MTDLRQYDPMQVVGTWATTSPLGSIDITDGVIDGGTFAAVASDNRRWVRENDRAGNSTRVKVNNKGGAVTISIAASSPTNRRLSLAAELDDATENVVGALVIRDLNGGTVIEADGAFLEGIPDPSFGNTRGQRDWVFQCATIRVHLEGHDLA